MKLLKHISLLCAGVFLSHVLLAEVTVTLDGPTEACLGNTIDIFISAEGLGTTTSYDSFSYASLYGGLDTVKYDVSETVEPQTSLIQNNSNGLNAVRGTFFETPGILLKIQLLANKTGSIEIELIDFLFGGDTFAVEPITIKVLESPKVSYVAGEFDYFNTPTELTGGLPEGGIYSGSAVENGFLNLENKSVTERNQIVYTYTNDAGCTGKDSSNFTVRCNPTVRMEAETEVCLGDTIELSIIADSLTELCQYESYIFTSAFGSLTLHDYTATESVDPEQFFMPTTYGPMTMFVSQLMGTFYSGSGNLIKFRLLATEVGDYTIELMNFQFGGDVFSVEPITIHVGDSATKISIAPLTIEQGQTAELIPTTTIAAPYEWVLPNETTLTTDKITVSESGMYHVSVTDMYGCSAADSALVTVTQKQIPAITTMLNAEQSDFVVLVSPVPVDAEVRVSANFIIKQLTVTDEKGSRVFSLLTELSKSTILDLSHLSQGVYILQVTGESGETAQKIFHKL